MNTSGALRAYPPVDPEKQLVDFSLSKRTRKCESFLRA